MIIAVLVEKVIAFIIKSIYFFPRPYIVNRKPTFVTIPPIDSSFPSEHTALAFALATIIYLHNRKLGTILFFVAAAIGLARIFANVHYPIDVVSGLVMGVTIGLICDKIKTYVRRNHHSPSRRKNKRKS